MVAGEHFDVRFARFSTYFHLPQAVLLENILRWLRQLYSLFWMLVLSALLGVAIYFAWHWYQDERLLSQLRSNGQLVTVTIDEADEAPRTFRDEWSIQDVVYLRFAHERQRYETRFVEDTLRPRVGDRVTLLYNPELNLFGKQPPRATTETRVVSRLVNWTRSIPFSAETRALVLLVMTAVALFFVGGGLLAPLLGLTIIQSISRTILFVGLAGIALFAAYEAVEYYRYVDRLQRNGRPMEVVVLSTYDTPHGKRSYGRYYTYEATFRFNNQERVIAIEKEDFERLNSQNARLTVLYDPELNDFIVTNYSLFNWDALGPLIFSLMVIFGVFLWAWMKRRRHAPATAVG